jgi:hypothetical protein
MRYDMRPDRSGWTVFDVTTGRTVSLAADLTLVGVDHDEADRLVDLLNAGDIQWNWAIASEMAALLEHAALVRELGYDP